MEFYEHELMKDMTHRCGKKKNYKFARRVTSVTNGRLSPWPLLPRRPLQKTLIMGRWQMKGSGLSSSLTHQCDAFCLERDGILQLQ